MSNKNFIKDFIGIQEVNITNYEETEKEIFLHIELEVKEHKCPCCSEPTTRIHDYRIQRVTDIPYRNKKVIFVYRKRRYVCPHCGKRFYEENTFLPRYHQMTNRLSAYIIERLRNTDSFSKIAREVGKSTSTVIRVFDLLSFSKPKLPKVLSIDEFKGNTGKEKYQVIITNPATHQVLDILESRKKLDLIQYLREYDKTERLKVEYFISDMYKPYKEIAQTYFKNATIITDKYHWIRQSTWAIERVRKDIQKKFSKEYRIYFKHSRKLLLAYYDKLNLEQQQQVNVMLSVSADLSTAHFLKEWMYKILKIDNKEIAIKEFKQWIDEANESGIKEFQSATTAYKNWYREITNSFCQNLTNGFTEGCNNKIKVLKRNAYGYQRFDRFRKRILFMFTEAA
ncbi:MAG: ISL3 family transposase [Oscillospiraceae bacterium]|nr:ISL3 family transposase [Oscillospiraceae bacterium]